MAATETALERMSDQEVLREKAIQLGRSAAGRALHGAYEKLMTPRV